MPCPVAQQCGDYNFTAKTVSSPLPCSILPQRVRQRAVRGDAGDHSFPGGFLVGLRFPASGKITAPFADTIPYSCICHPFGQLEMALLRMIAGAQVAVRSIAIGENIEASSQTKQGLSISLVYTAFHQVGDLY